MAVLRPFFKHYGGKWRLAGKVPAPRYGRIVEPFAGGAGYSVRYGAGKRVDLYDVDPVTCSIWRWLFAATPADVLALPVDPVWEGADVRELELEEGAMRLIQRWLTMQGSVTNWTMPPSSRVCVKAKPGSVWSCRVRQRIADQLPAVYRWSITQAPYTEIDTTGPAHWHVDPPYQNNAAAQNAYGPESSVDYAHLAAWCQTLAGDVTVHEQEGATWLPFRTLDANSVCGRVDGKKCKRQHEVWWTREDADDTDVVPATVPSIAHPTLQPPIQSTTPTPAGLGRPAPPGARRGPQQGAPRMAKTERPHVADVRANIKIPMAATFGPKTLILGDNGTGKSTLTAAVELALAGYASDVAGNPTETREAELHAHLAPNRDGTASATVTMSDGTVYAWEKAAGERARSAHAAGSPFVLSAVAGIGSWTNDKVNDWVSRHVAARATKAQAQTAWQEVPSRLHGVIMDAANHDEDKDGALTDRSDFDVLLNATQAHVKKKQAEVREAKKAVDTVGPTGVVDPDALAALDARLTAMREAQAKAATSGVDEAVHKRAQEVHAYWTQHRDGLAHAAAEAARNVTAAEGVLAQAEAQAQAATEQRAKFTGLRDFLTRANPDATSCVCCGSAHPEGMGAHYAALIPEIDALLAGLADPTAAARADLAKWRDAAQQAQQALAQADSQIQQAADVLARPVAGAVDHTAEIAQLQAQRDRMVQDQALAERAARARTLRDQAEAAVADGKQAVEKLKAARGVFTDAGISDIEDQVSRYLPNGARFRIVREGVHTRVGVQFDGDDYVTTSPSGSQEAVMLAAIGCAFAPEDGPAVVLMPDRQWDPAHLQATMRAVAKSDVQIVFVSTVKPKGKIPKAWTVIDLGSGDGVEMLDEDGEDDGEDAGESAAAAEPAAAAAAVSQEAAPSPFVTVGEAK